MLIIVPSAVHLRTQNKNNQNRGCKFLSTLWLHHAAGARAGILFSATSWHTFRDERMSVSIWGSHISPYTNRITKRNWVPGQDKLGNVLQIPRNDTQNQCANTRYLLMRFDCQDRNILFPFILSARSFVLYIFCRFFEAIHSPQTSKLTMLLGLSKTCRNRLGRIRPRYTSHVLITHNDWVAPSPPPSASFCNSLRHYSVSWLTARPHMLFVHVFAWNCFYNSSRRC